jgi:hypothetical protein
VNRQRKSKPKTAPRASVAPAGTQPAGDIVELLPPGLASAVAMSQELSGLHRVVLADMNPKSAPTPEQRERSRKAWERGRKAGKAARRVLEISPEGRPRKDEERNRVRELKTAGKTWGEIQIQMNKETDQSKTKDAYRALATRKSK